MADHNELGRLGEEEALLYLTLHEYALLDRNWHDKHLEIDIVAEYFGEIIFVEVKTRCDERYARAVDAVTPEKKRNLIRAAHSWLVEHQRTESPYRYDIITLVGQASPFKIEHHKNAYDELRTLYAHLSPEHDEFRV